MEKRKYLYDTKKIDWNNLMFDKAALKALLIPLLIEQFLNSFMGMADTMMVSRIGGEAISAVSLVDSLNILVIQVFAALATGGTICCAYCLGKKDRRECNLVARQIFWIVLVISGTIMILCELFHQWLLTTLFGSVEPGVMSAARIYFVITVLSFPFLALFQTGAAFFRAGGNSAYPMKISVISNVLNIAGNAVLIFGLGWGVLGAALSTLFSRIFCVICTFYSLRKDRQPIVLRQYFGIKPDWKIIGKVLHIGVPSGIENGMFQFGKLAIQSSVSTLGTAAIAAQAMTIILETVNSMVGIGIGIGLMTVVGQCMGAQREEEAKYYIVRLSWIAEIGIFVSCIFAFGITKPVTMLAGMEVSSAKMCMEMVLAITIVKPFVWVLSFVPAYGLRAAGDVKFSMTVSMITMWFCRVLLAVSLIRFFGFGPMAVWIGMFADWSIRAIVFTLRFLSGKWLKKRVIFP